MTPGKSPHETNDKIDQQVSIHKATITAIMTKFNVFNCFFLA